MRRLGFLLVAIALPAYALTPEAEEFLGILKRLEPAHCQKRKLRREIVSAEVEKRDADAAALKRRFDALERDPQTSRLEQRLAVLRSRLLDSHGTARHAEDLEALSLQQREALYRCE